MNITRSYAVFLRIVYLYRASPSRWVMILFWAVADLLIWGLLTVYLTRVGGATLNFVTVLVGAVVMEHLIIRAQTGVSISSMEDVWTRNFINLFATPLTLGEYALGLLMSAIATAAISTVFIALLAKILFSYSIIQFGPAIALYAGTLFLFGASLGMLGISMIIRFGPSAEAFVWTLPAALAPFSGVFYPISTLPPAIQWVSRLIPSTYIFEGMRGVVLGQNFNGISLAMGIILSLFYFLIGYVLLNRQFMRALKHGSLTRFLSDTG